jgi:tRNA 2-thiouridine synthesizing protein A
MHRSGPGGRPGRTPRASVRAEGVGFSAADPDSPGDGYRAEAGPRPAACTRIGRRPNGRWMGLEADVPRAAGKEVLLIPDAEWDAGDLSCGDLVLDLRRRIQSLRIGQTLKVVARDPGAPADLPAWCRLTGHTLVRAEHPLYWVRREQG